MPEASLVPKFLKEFAVENDFAVYDCLYGSINLGQTSPVEQSCGAVYGIWAQSPAPLTAGLSPLPGYPQWYPVYWGKDISPVSRLKAHVQGHRNGNINLPSIREVQGLPLVFGSILVSRYEQFERLLHSRFPPLRGSGRTGRQATVVRIRP
jgi:hypothetical protein